MERGMTIQMFSERTGLPPSTLRYYEKEKLIEPYLRGENSYRLYTETQIPLALTIHSLRQADVKLRDIRSYLASHEKDKAAWVRKWREEIDVKLSSLQIARQYLQGIERDDQYIRLIKWDQAVSILWLPISVTRELNPYAKTIRHTANLLRSELDLRINEAFIKTEHVDQGSMSGQMGFRLYQNASAVQEWAGEHQGTVQQFPPALFVTLECMATDRFACFNLMLLLQSFGFEPSGPRLERYNLNDMSSYQWMIPVLHRLNQQSKK